RDPSELGVPEIEAVEALVARLHAAVSEARRPRSALVVDTLSLRVSGAALEVGDTVTIEAVARDSSGGRVFPELVWEAPPGAAALLEGEHSRPSRRVVVNEAGPI